MESLPCTLAELRQFVAVVETGGFTAAAHRLHQTTASVSLAIKRMETQLGARLFERSTRNLQLTEQGAQFYQVSKRTLSVLQEGVESLRVSQDAVRGPLVIAAPGDLALTLLGRMLREFQHKFPEVALDLRVSDSVSGVVGEGIDLALRYGPLPDSELVARELHTGRRLLCASPDYLNRAGVPRSLADLSEHRCLCFRRSGRADTQWQFMQEGERFAVTVNCALVTDNSAVARDWALAGEGLVYKSGLDVHDDIAAGRLQTVLTDYQGIQTPLFAVYAGAQYQPRRLRELLGFLQAAFAQIPD
ncbi:LysR family transcriptional regulator [Teredinibacter turnerae]|uniref:LysR family transcriptional regulator n=1 Tax=Teredinibacter turnerae TaxID=2426 RepID=UPI0030CFF3BE